MTGRRILGAAIGVVAVLGAVWLVMFLTRGDTTAAAGPPLGWVSPVTGAAR